MSLRSLPPLAQLRAFAALAETGAMSSAGALLNVSHAAVSQQVRALEAHLGVTLVRREGRGVALTPEGARLGQTLRDAFGAISGEVEALSGADAARPLQITTTPMFASSWLMPRIAEFRRRHPGIDLMLNPSPGLAALEPGGIDVALRFGTGSWPGLDAEMLLPTQFVIVATRGLIGDRRIDDPHQLLDYPWLQELGSDEAVAWLGRHGVPDARPRGLSELPGNLVLEGVRAGQGVAVTTRAFVAAEIDSGALVELFADNDPETGYFIVTRPGPLRPPAKAFVAWLRREAASDPDPAPTARAGPHI